MSAESPSCGSITVAILVMLIFCWWCVGVSPFIKKKSGRRVVVQMPQQQAVLFLTLSLFFEKKYLVCIEKYMFEIPLIKLSCTIDQIYILKGQGISQIFEKDVFDISKKSDIIFRIKFI